MENKETLLDLISSCYKELEWKRDENSSYFDYEYEFYNGLKLRVVELVNDKYLQVILSCSKYRIFDFESTPLVNMIIRHIKSKEQDERDKEFYAKACDKLRDGIKDEYGIVI